MRSTIIVFQTPGVAIPFTTIGMADFAFTNVNNDLWRIVKDRSGSFSRGRGYTTHEIAKMVEKYNSLNGQFSSAFKELKKDFDINYGSPLSGVDDED